MAGNLKYNSSGHLTYNAAGHLVYCPDCANRVLYCNTICLPNYITALAIPSSCGISGNYGMDFRSYNQEWGYESSDNTILIHFTVSKSANIIPTDTARYCSPLRWLFQIVKRTPSGDSWAVDWTLYSAPFSGLSDWVNDQMTLAKLCYSRGINGNVCGDVYPSSVTLMLGTP